MVCFRYIIVNTLHKGDDDDDDNNNNSTYSPAGVTAQTTTNT